MIISTLPHDQRATAEARIVQTLRDHAEAQGQGFRRLALTLEAREGADWLGGLTGYLGRDWLYVELLAVADGARGRGIGEGLMTRAAEVARAHGLTGIWVDTYSFQAPGFYQRLGFQEIGRIVDQPLGQARLFFARGWMDLFTV